MGDTKIISGVTEQPGRLDKALSQASGLSRERVKALITQGMVWIAGAVASSPSAKVQAGTEFSIHIPPPTSPQAFPQNIPITVVHEDPDLIVIDKPAGMVVHPGAGNPDGTLVNALLHHCHGQLSGIGGVERPGIVHRIDKDTTGLLVVAKSDAAHQGLAAQFADHSIERAYLAIAKGQPAPSAGTIRGRIGRSDRDRKKMAVLPPEATRGKEAVTHFKTLKLLNNAAIVQCRLETGRTHQVRVHMASIGHPLLGDQSYGRSDAVLRPIFNRLGFARQALHAAELGFLHPVAGNKLHFRSELPLDLEELIDELDH